MNFSVIGSVVVLDVTSEVPLEPTEKCEIHGVSKLHGISLLRSGKTEKLQFCSICRKLLELGLSRHTKIPAEAPLLKNTIRLNPSC